MLTLPSSKIPPSPTFRCAAGPLNPTQPPRATCSLDRKPSREYHYTQITSASGTKKCRGGQGIIVLVHNDSCLLFATTTPKSSCPPDQSPFPSSKQVFSSSFSSNEYKTQRPKRDKKEKEKKKPDGVRMVRKRGAMHCPQAGEIDVDHPRKKGSSQRSE